MSEVIYKYTLKKTANNEICAEMPFNAKIISVGYQRGDIQVWAIVNPSDKDFHTVFFNVYGTGHEVNKIEGKFLGTVVWPDGSLVFHIYLK